MQTKLRPRERQGGKTFADKTCARYDETAMSEPETLLQILKDTLSEEPDILLAIVYGSLASGRFRPDSDVDIAVYCASSLGTSHKMSMIEKLSERLHREIDLVDLHSAHGVLLQQILTKGEILIKRDNDAYAALLKRMIFEQEDFLPYYRRLLRERRERFIHGTRSD